MIFARPCLDCGLVSREGNRCIRCQTAYNRARYIANPKPKPYASREWRNLSAKVRKQRPWCEMCGKTTNLTVDHIIPISKGGRLIAPVEQLRVLCRSCHGKVTEHPRTTHECS